MVSHNVPVELEGLEFHVSLVVLKPSNINLILGMEWLKTYTASIIYAPKTVPLLHPSSVIVSYHAHLV